MACFGSVMTSRCPGARRLAKSERRRRVIKNSSLICGWRTVSPRGRFAPQRTQFRLTRQIHDRQRWFVIFFDHLLHCATS
jgi:hypothetical protein